MKLTRVVTLAMFGTLTLGAQEPASTSSAATSDVQAIRILSQALDAVGGQAVFSAASGFTASGTIIHHWGEKDVEGAVTVNGRASGNFRMDENLPSGTRSWAVSRGKAHEKTEDGTLSEAHGFSILNASGLVNPYFQLAQALKGKGYIVSYKGQTTVDGNPAFDIQIRQAVVLPDGTLQALEIGSLEVFIDAASFHVLMTRDQARPSRNSAEGPPHEIRFSDYRPVNNLLVPHLIVEIIGNQETWRLQLSSFQLNSSLSDASFTLN